ATTNTSDQPQESQNPTNEEAEQNTANEEAAQNLYEPRKRKKSSPVWVNFKEVMVGTKQKWECIHCKTKFKRVPSGTTTHLGRHIERCRRRKLQKRILNFCDLSPPHSGINISDVLHKCLVEWDIERNIWTITVDNASNNDVAMRTLKRTLTCMTTLPLGGDIFHVRCCAHILNIMVQFGLKEIEGVIENVRQSVKHIAISESRVNMFREVAKQLRLSGKKLILDCCTRWNSTFHMISVALEFKDVFLGYAARDPWYKWLPSEEDWQRVSQVCQFLEVFSEVTNIISGSSYTFANVFLPELWRIKVLLKNTIQSGDESMKGMARKMQGKFDKYCGECNLVIAFACVLDPRNKIRVVEVAFLYLNGEDNYFRHVQLVRGKLYELFEEYVEEYKAREVENRSDTTKNREFRVI
ncbi:Zinc finger BED domain-containing protein RICESLEEPER 2, partial [Linum perenne]